MRFTQNGTEGDMWLEISYDYFSSSGLSIKVNTKYLTGVFLWVLNYEQSILAKENVSRFHRERGWNFVRDIQTNIKRMVFKAICWRHGVIGARVRILIFSMLSRFIAQQPQNISIWHSIRITWFLICEKIQFKTNPIIWIHREKPFLSGTRTRHLTVLSPARLHVTPRRLS